MMREAAVEILTGLRRTTTCVRIAYCDNCKGLTVALDRFQERCNVCDNAFNIGPHNNPPTILVSGPAADEVVAGPVD